MRIMHLEASPGWGGQELRTLNEMIGMRSRGHELFLVVAQGGGLAPKARKQGFQVYELNFHKRNWLYCLIHLFRLFKKHQIQIVNTHSSLDSWIGGLASKMARIPVIRTRHLSTAIRKGLNSKILYGKLSNVVVTTCARIVPVIQEQAKVPKEHCVSIPTGIDPSKIQVDPAEVKAFRKSLGVSPEDCLVGMVCFMRSWKGVDDFLEAAYQLKKVPHLKWVIIGGGHSGKYMLKAKELQLDSVLSFTGHLENPFPAIASLDIFSLLSTAHEGVSQASLQAALFKKPLITTPTGGLCEVCIDQETGIQVPSFSPNRVAEAVLELQNDPKRREIMGKNAHDLVFSKFTYEIMLDRMEEIYSKIAPSSL